MSMSSQTLALGDLLVFPVFKTGKSSMAKTKKRLLCFDVEEKVLLKKDRTKVLSLSPFSSILSYVSDADSLCVTVEFVRQIRNSQETRKSVFISQNRNEKQALVAVLHSIIHNDWTYIFSTTQIPLESLNKPPPGLSTKIVGRGNLLMRGSKSNFENVLVTCVWGKMFIQQPSRKRGGSKSQGSNAAKRGGSSGESGTSCPNTNQTERAFSLVNGSLAVPDGSGRIDVVTPSHRLQFLVDAKSELGHDKWLKVLAQSIAIYDEDLKYFIDFGEMVKRQSLAARGKASAAVTSKTSVAEGMAGSPKKKDSNSDNQKPSSSSSSSIPYVRQSDGSGVMLARHYLLNFTVAFVPPLSCKTINAREKNELGQCRAVLHLDTLRKALEIFVKGTNVLAFKLQNVVKYERGSEGSFPSLCIHYKENGAKEDAPLTRIWMFFQAFHEIEVCTEVFVNALAGGKTKQPDLQRTIIRQGSIEKKGKSGIYGQRYAVLVPNKLILLRSKTAYIPLQVITFGSETRLWMVRIDDSDRSVLNMNPRFSKKDDHTSLEDSIGSLMNHCISLRFKDAAECSSWYDMLLKQSNKRVVVKKSKLSEEREEETKERVQQEKEVVKEKKQESEPDSESESDSESDSESSTQEDQQPDLKQTLSMGMGENSNRVCGNDADNDANEKGTAEIPDAAEAAGPSDHLQESQVDATPTTSGEKDVVAETETAENGLKPAAEFTVEPEPTSKEQEEKKEERVGEERVQDQGGRPGADKGTPDKTVQKAFEFWGVKKKA